MRNLKQAFLRVKSEQSSSNPSNEAGSFTPRARDAARCRPLTAAGPPTPRCVSGGAICLRILCVEAQACVCVWLGNFTPRGETLGGGMLGKMFTPRGGGGGGGDRIADGAGEQNH